jgi:hypothetical protein
MILNFDRSILSINEPAMLAAGSFMADVSICAGISESKPDQIEIAVY